MSSLLQDLRVASRQLVRSPGFAVAAIVTLALGIGANTAIFSVVNGLLLRPPAHVRDFDRLAAVYTSDHSGPPYGSSSLPDVEEFGAGALAFDGLAAYSLAPVVLSDPARTTEAELVVGHVVTANFFDVLGVTAVQGRTFAGEEAGVAGRGDVVVLGHAFWRTRLGADPAIVGRTIRLAGQPFTVIGIAPDGFTGLLPGLVPAFYAPMAAAETIGFLDPRERGDRGLLVIGRLAEGASLEQARAQLAAAGRSLAERYPSHWTDVRGEPRRISVLAARDALVPPQVRGPVTGFVALLMLVVGGVLLIGCANIANLLLARATGRQREIGIRLALGAGRARLVRQLLTESMLLAGIGAALGVGLAYAGTRALASVELPLPVDIRLNVTPDLTVLAFSGFVAVAAGLLFGLAPALLATRRSVVASLRTEDAQVGGRRLGLRGVLAAGQIAVAIVLLVAGGLLLRSLQSAQTIAPGFRTDGMLFFNLAQDENATTAEQRLVFHRQLRERVAALPGVRAVSNVTELPLGAGQTRRSFSVEGYRPGDGEDMELSSTYAGPGYFEAMGTRLVRGRDFSAADGPGAPQVAIVNEAFMRQYLGGGDAIGKRLGRGGNDPLTIEIIGVAEDGRYRTLGEAARPFVWLASDQNASGFTTLVVHGAGELAPLRRAVAAVVADIAPDAAVTSVVSAEEHLAFALLPQRAGAWLLGLFGLLGLALAALGIYGVMAYAVSRRTREIGVRLALGARPGDVVRMVVRQGMRVAAIGAILGLAVAAGLSRLMGFLLFDVAPLDVPTYAGVALVVGAVTLLANWLPARRTARVDPVRALRFD
jgi:macrolide transport system ATP-binding/permease protein